MWLKNYVCNMYFDFFYTRLFEDKRTNLGPILTLGPGTLKVRLTLTNF